MPFNVTRIVVLTALVLAAFLPTAVLQAQGPEVAGHWEGRIEIPGNTLQILVDFTAGEKGLTGVVSIPIQQAKDLPLADIRREGDGIAFAIAGIPGNPAFKGKVSADGVAIKGDFTQGGATFPFVLERKENPEQAAQKALQDIPAVAEDALKRLKVPGVAVGIVKNGKIVYTKGFGLRDVEKNLPVTPDTLFAIGSATKAFTALLLEILSDEGKVELDQPLRRYIPWFRLLDKEAGDRLTPRDLLTHRSGLPRHDLLWYNNLAASRRELVESLAHLPATADLRTRFQYNNLMFLTAGYLAEVLTGKTWEENIRERIFSPLDMKRSNFSVDEARRDADCALPYDERDGKMQQIPFRGLTNMGPAGSINSSVNEMCRWLLLHLGDGQCAGRRVVSATALRDAHTPVMKMNNIPAHPALTSSDYALGWMTDIYRNHPRIHHGGNIDGFSAMVTLLPKDDIGIVVLTNKNGTPLQEVLVRLVADRLLGLEPIDWVGLTAQQLQQGESAQKEARTRKFSVRRSGTRPSHNPDEYIGEYDHPAYGRMTVTLAEKNTLQVAYHGIVTPLAHWHYDTFNGQAGLDPVFTDQKYTFRTDVRGNVSALEVALEPTLPEVVFTRRPSARLFDPAYLQRFTGVYELTGQVLTITLQGNTLLADLSGQKPTELIPALGDEFTLKAAPIVTVFFVQDEKGVVSAAEIRQPDGVYKAVRRK